jgi:hypothetical protein
MVRRGGEHGYPRQPWQTPTEYAHRLIDSLPEATKDIEIMNSQFLEARYSLHEISEEQVSLVSSSWDRIRKVLRSLFSE